MSPSPYWRSRVTPGSSETMAARLRVRRLNSVDLPTLGRPTKATTGFMRALCLRGASAALFLRQSESGQRSRHTADEKRLAIDNRRRPYRSAADRRTRHQAAVVAREPMHVALVVGDRDHIAVNDRRVQPPAVQAFLLPQTGARAPIESENTAFVVGEIEVGAIRSDAGISGNVARPDHGAAARIERDQFTLITRRVHRVRERQRRSIDVDQPVDLVATARLTDRGFPHRRSVPQAQRREL